MNCCGERVFCQRWQSHLGCEYWICGGSEGISWSMVSFSLSVRRRTALMRPRSPLRAPSTVSFTAAWSAIPMNRI